MRFLTAVVLCLVAEAVHADVDVFTVSADQWALQRSGAALVRLEPVREAVADWLVALGVPADHIGKRASADQPDDAVALRVEH